MPTILISTRLRTHTDKHESVVLNGATVGEILEKLVEAYPGLQKKLFDDAGAVRAKLNIYLNDEDIRLLEKEGTQVTDTDTISIGANSVRRSKRE